jgi:hypothetical protein
VKKDTAWENPQHWLRLAKDCDAGFTLARGYALNHVNSEVVGIAAVG